MKKRMPLIIGLLLMVIGIGILVYPSVVICINERFSTSAINNYADRVNTLSEEEINDYINAAEEYNERLKGTGLGFDYSVESAIGGYEDILSFQDGIVGYIKIPKINLNLPIYHGSDEKALSKGVAHLPNTAFPVGGLGNHCVLAAHTAYADQIFFDYIYKLEPGDKIYIIILNKTYTYVVRETNIVIPTDTSPCAVENKKDLLSLVTCWPYAQNTHRLIVTAERVETESSQQSDGEGDISHHTGLLSKDNMSGNGEEILSDDYEEENTPLNTHEIIVVSYIAFVIISILVILIILFVSFIKRIRNSKKKSEVL